jgi:hypothetical protein
MGSVGKRLRVPCLRRKRSNECPNVTSIETIDPASHSISTIFSR